MNNVKVSILCTTYNHEKYIKQALDGFISQKVNFNIEILIHDDCSTDGTSDILREYVKKYKNIKLYTEKVNQYSKNNYTFINDLFVKAKGQYIAFCEGDDYWDDFSKLQKQVDFMDTHPVYALCFHPVRVVYENKALKDSIFPNSDKKINFTIEELLRHNFIQTNSVLYRRLKYDNLPANIIPSDWYLHLYHAAHGKIGFINEVMSVYRRHSGGVWWDSTNNIQNIWNKYGLGHLRLYQEQLKLFGHNKEYVDIINNHITEMIFNICTVKSLNNENIDKILSAYPIYVKEYLVKISKDKAKLDNEKALLISEIDSIKQDVLANNEKMLIYKDRISQLENELKSIKESKSWKVIQKYRKLHNTMLRR